MRWMTIVLTLVSLAACDTDAHLAYVPYAGLTRDGPPVIGAVTATDRRKEAPRRLATIMGGFGNPLKILNTIDPVKDEVAHVFAQGLAARGLSGDDATARFRVLLLIRKFDADMIMGSKARIDIDFDLADARTGAVIYHEAIADQRVAFHVFATGVFGNVAELQKLSQDLLDATVDRMLDKPAFRRALVPVPVAAPAS